jgi:heavy metal sensor kinase
LTPGLLYFAPDGRLQLNEAYHSRPEAKLLIDRLMEVRDSTGAVLFRSRQLEGEVLGGSPLPDEFTDGHRAWKLRLGDGRRVLGVSHRHPVQGRMLLLRVAYGTDPLRRRVTELFGILMLVFPVPLILAGVGGYHFAGKILKPLDAMARRTEQITVKRLHSRISIENPNDEFGHMAAVLNGLLERLEQSFAQLRRFTSDVSHELRTPLSSIRSVGEVGLQRMHTGEEYRDIIGSMLEEVARLSSTIDTLLTIAHADSGALQLHRTVFPRMDLVEESASVVGVLAEDKGQGLSITGDSSISVSADRGFLRMAIINLLDNAVKYSPSGTTIHVMVESCTVAGAEGAVRLAIKDEGPGIPPEAVPRVFDRFYRLDEGRAREAGGAGLELAIAKWSVEAHGGEITLASTPGMGSTFTICLPGTEPRG